MISYFNLMIATDRCFAITPVDAWHEHDLMALGLMALDTVHRPGQVDQDRSVGTRPNKRQHRAMRLRTTVDHLSRSSGPPCGIGTMDLRPSTIAARCGSTVCRIVGWKNLRAAENAL